MCVEGESAQHWKSGAGVVLGSGGGEGKTCQLAFKRALCVGGATGVLEIPSDGVRAVVIGVCSD